MSKRVFAIDKLHPAWRDVVGRLVAEIQERVQSGPVRVTVDEPKRTLPENALLHALISELARKVEWAGAKRDVETWKRLLVSAWCRAEGKALTILPALDGNGVELVPVRTSNLGKRACAELIEFIYAWGVDQGVKWDSHESGL